MLAQAALKARMHTGAGWGKCIKIHLARPLLPSIMAQPTHQNALPLGSMLMEYRLTSVLGAGGFGITYLARDTNLEKDVAIKEYLPGSVAVRAPDQSVRPTSPAQQDDYKWGLERFIQESRTLARFGHPNIVRVNRFFESNGTGYMVMDYEDGEPLKSFLKRKPFPAEAELKKVLSPLLDGLEKVHAAGFLHRDIKPDNIFVRKDGGPVLIDFGSARQAVGGATQTLTTIVSPGYAPFEQYTTSAEQGPWSDIYSLSGVLYFAVTGQAPPDAISRMKGDTMAKGLGAARMRYTAHFIDAIAWGLAMEEQARPRTVAQWREVLFGQKSLAAQAQAPKPQRAPAPAKAPAQQPVSDQAQRAIAIATAMAESSRRHQESRASPWRWITPGAIVIALAVVGVRFLPSQQPRSSTSDVRIITVTPVSVPPQKFAPLTPPPPAAAPQTPAAPDSQSPAVAGDVRATAQTAAGAPDPGSAVSPPPAEAVPAALPPAAVPTPRSLSPVMEARLEARMHLLDPGNTGLTREQLATAFPHAADHFQEIDTNHDGRVTLNELLAAWTRITPFPQAREQ
jgi:serine/threonine protein kinase